MRTRHAFSRPGAALGIKRPEYDPYIVRVQGQIRQRKIDFISAPLRQEIIALFWRHQGRWIRPTVVARALGYTDVKMVAGALKSLAKQQGRLVSRVRDDGVQEYQYAETLFGN